MVSAWTGYKPVDEVGGRSKLSADAPVALEDGPGSLLTKPKSDLRDKGRTIFLLCAAVEGMRQSCVV